MTEAKTKEVMNNNKGRKYKQQVPQQKPQTQSRTTGIRQQTPKGMRNYTKTGTKEAQTTDNRTEGRCTNICLFVSLQCTIHNF